MATTMTIEEWKAEGLRLFGSDKLAWKFVCPSCGHQTTVKDWRDAKAPEGAVAFSCVGRYQHADGTKAFKKAGGPCNYAGGGLFKLNPITVIDEGGAEHQVFDFARREAE
jgi:predicted RNA-binding Zn-ribbon protein involved in translation (DUF1610 family)